MSDTVLLQVPRWLMESLSDSIDGVGPLVLGDMEGSAEIHRLYFDARVLRDMWRESTNG